MKILVISDVHLGKRFIEKKALYLEKIISQSDHVIINGDFWDNYDTTFDHFVKSPWKRLFPLLKNKKAVYIFGNHDRAEFSDKRVNEFSVVQTNRHQIKIGKKSLVFEHGHKLVPFYEEIIPLVILKPVNAFFSTFQKFLIHNRKKTFSKFFFKKLSRFNRTIKKKIVKEMENGQVLICGHTHVAEADDDNRFFNSGFIQYGLAQYLLIEQGVVAVREEWYG